MDPFSLFLFLLISSLALGKCCLFVQPLFIFAGQIAEAIFSPHDSERLFYTYDASNSISTSISHV